MRQLYIKTIALGTKTTPTRVDAVYQWRLKIYFVRWYGEVFIIFDMLTREENIVLLLINL